jgi:hypothetical protein
MQRPRTPSQISESLHRRLNSYALAASAAGVGMLAPANVSEAKIVYTKTYEVIGRNSVYPLDLNHDGTIDFLIHQLGSTVCSSPSTAGIRLWVKEAFGNAVEASKYHSAAALTKGAVIGSQQRFVSSTGSVGELMVDARDGNFSPYGPWLNVRNRYLGLKFLIKGKAHYGWGRLSVKVHGCKITATLTGYAYETIPNKPIVAGQTHGSDDATDGMDSAKQENPAATVRPVSPIPQPASLDRLALGAPGIQLWRQP